MFALLKRSPNRHQRATRVSIPHKEKVVLAIDKARVACHLCQLSVNGGTLRLAQRVAPGTLAGVSLKTDTGLVEGAIQMLGVVDEVLEVQAFRFVHMAPPDRQRLQGALQRMHQQGQSQGRAGSIFESVKRFALRLSETSFGVTRS